VRVAVARRQCLRLETIFPKSLASTVEAICAVGSARAQLDALLSMLSTDGSPLHLDHDPALGARVKVLRHGEIIGYLPTANDPEFLIYREAGAHRIKTNVRGEHGQHPDRVLIKKQRRRERGSKKRRSRPIPSRKNPWPKGRKLRSRHDKANRKI
jgi:hypothetical protein